MNDFGLEPGQVWELMNDGAMVPAMLLRLDERAGGEWDCLSLYDGTVFSANLNRWRDKTTWVLVGDRLA